MKKLFLLLCFPLCTFSANATHIIGGEMSYVCLGNDSYEITLKLYRDCYNAQAPYDNPAYLTVFNSSGIIVELLTILFPGSDTLSVQTNCAAIVPYVCAEQAIYTDTVTLPPLAGGYTLVYQRCCRSSIIENILDPLNTGMSVTATIPDPSLATCNNSPVFINNPPFAFCIGVPISYDHSAVDPDGDSLVYELCPGVSGATSFDPMPLYPLPPPYADVTYVSPYSGGYPFNTNPALAIDPQTGMLSGTPSSIGIFSLAVCVKEYRNGNLLGIHRRELAQVYTISGGANPTGVNGIVLGDINIYPNPAHESIVIDASNTGSIIEEIKICNAIGQEVKAFIPAAGEKLISADTHDVPAGMYFVRVVTQNGILHSPLMVVK